MPPLRRKYTMRVLVPCYKESLAIIQRTVLAARRADRPAGTHVIIYVCDDGADPKKADWVRALHSALHSPLSTLHSALPQKPAVHVALRWVLRSALQCPPQASASLCKPLYASASLFTPLQASLRLCRPLRHTLCCHTQHHAFVLPRSCGSLARLHVHVRFVAWPSACMRMCR
jgi:cellulose synthase/poly-beta-1,6-N-acetylglucosamine synthase-like glycosyltransferase